MYISKHISLGVVLYDMTITVSAHFLGFFITNAVIFVIHKQYLVITTGSSKYKKNCKHLIEKTCTHLSKYSDVLII